VSWSRSNRPSAPAGRHRHGMSGSLLSSYSCAPSSSIGQVDWIDHESSEKITVESSDVFALNLFSRWSQLSATPLRPVVVDEDPHCSSTSPRCCAISLTGSSAPCGGDEPLRRRLRQASRNSVWDLLHSARTGSGLRAIVVTSVRLRAVLRRRGRASNYWSGTLCTSS
jgi:hypothetical protein